MTCFTCKGDMEKSLTTYMTEYNGCFLIIKNVPCSKCTQCGEEYLNGVTLQKIESILEKFKIMLTEIAIVDYNKAAQYSMRDSYVFRQYTINFTKYVRV